MKKIFITLLLMLSFTLSSAEILEYNKLKKGMEGVGKTIFRGTNIETFKFKILGFLKNFSPGKNLIIAELFSPELEGIGVIAGMSGSPVFVNGKIIGSVSYGFNFSKKPIAGITPIEDIIKVKDYDTPEYSIDISDIKVQFDKENVKNIKKRLKVEMSRRINPASGGDFLPIGLLSTSRGITGEADSFLRPLFTPTNNLKLDSSKQEQLPGDNSIQGAEAVSIPLVRGDFEYSSSGTVTYTEGKKVYLFGHPFFNLGRVEFPMHKAEVVSVVPSYQESFKLSSTGKMIGTITQDRFSSVMGETGKKPYMIPLQVFFSNRNRKFNIEMVSHPLLTPAMAQVSIANIFLTEIQQYGFNSIKVDGKIFIENEKNIIIKDLFSGGNSYNEFADLLLAINFFIMNNKEKQIKIQKMDFNVTVSESIKRGEIVNALINKNVFRPGELMDIKILIKNERGDMSVESIRLKAPVLKNNSEFTLLIADKKEIGRFESKNIKSSFFPSTLNSLIRAINNLRKNNRIYIKMTAPRKGMFFKGYEFSNLPSGMRNLYNYNSPIKNQTEIKYSSLEDYQMEVPVIITGKKIFKLKIRER
ncbi:MAG: SpoIVB peptidase S55 domain-containing protein [Acidobacteriota bacterium]